MRLSGLIAAVVALCAALAGCGGPQRNEASAPLVKVTRLESRETPNIIEIPGLVVPEREVEIRSRTSGLVVSRLFQGGETVAAGQLLFTIDPTTYQTAVVNARADLAQAQAAVVQSQGDVNRYRPLLPDNAISRQTYDQAVALTAQNQAVVQARRAALRLAELNLSYTKIRSPIAGNVDEPKVDLGSLVTAGTTPLTVVSTLDPVYVQFSLPEADYVRYVRANGLDLADARRITLRVVLPDGAPYGPSGRVDTVSRTIAETGTLTLRGLFPNPAQLLRPGLTVRVELPVAPEAPAVLAPQRAVGDLLGRKYVYVVGPGGLVEQRFVTLGREVGTLQVITAGARAGETIIVDGLQLARPGQPVRAEMTPLSPDG